MALVLTLSYLSQKSESADSERLRRELEKRAKTPAPLTMPALVVTNQNTNAAATNIQLEVKALPLTNSPAATTNQAPAAAPNDPAAKAP